MFELNPFSHPNAWWQHTIILAVAAIIGYIIGYRSGKITVYKLEEDLLSLDSQLLKCQSEKGISSKMKTLSNDVLLSDNLKMIEGIGPKIEQLLKANGLRTFSELSKASVDTISDILKNAGTRYQMHDPSTWPRQADLAERGEWEKLKEWQDELDKGKE